MTTPASNSVGKELKENFEKEELTVECVIMYEQYYEQWGRALWHNLPIDVSKSQFAS